MEEVEEEPQDETPCEPDCAEVECGPTDVEGPVVRVTLPQPVRTDSA